MNEIKSYVSKLNDRNLQRKRESGITTYAFYSITIIVLYQIINIYPYIDFKPYFWHNIIFIAYTTNMLTGIKLIFSTYRENTNSYSSSLRIISNHQKLLFDQVFHFCITALTMIINALAWKSTSNDSIFRNDIYFIIITVFYIIIVLSISPFFKKKTIGYSYKILEGSNKTATDKNPFCIILYTIGLLFLTSSFYYIFCTNHHNKQKIFLFSIYLYSFVFILEKIIELHKQDNFTEALEELEYEINVKNLDKDEIREKLQNNYLGYHLSDWIIQNTNLLDSLILETEKNTSELYDVIAKLKHNNKEKTNLYLKEINMDLDNFVKQKLRDIEGFWRISRINIIDRKDLSEFYDRLKKLQ